MNSQTTCQTSSWSRESQSQGRWPLERVLFAIAGTVVLISVLLAVLVSGWFLLLTAFVGINQWLFVLVRRLPDVSDPDPCLPPEAEP